MNIYVWQDPACFDKYASPLAVIAVGETREEAVDNLLADFDRRCLEQRDEKAFVDYQLPWGLNKADGQLKDFRKRLQQELLRTPPSVIEGPAGVWELEYYDY